MTISSSHAIAVLRLLLACFADDDEVSAGELRSIQIAIDALSGRLNGMDVTGVLETLGALAAADLHVENAHVIQAALSVGLDAVIEQTLASGTGHTVSMPVDWHQHAGLSHTL